MELYVFNKNLELVHVIDEFTSLIWTRKYNRPGEFELHLPLNENNIKHLTKGNIIYKKGDLEAGYIETRQLGMGADGQETLEVKGKFLTGYLDRRINWDRMDFRGKVEELMRELVNDNAVKPNDVNRKIPNLILGELKGFTEVITYQNSFGNLLECLENMSNTSNLGYRNLIDIRNKKILFEVYKGVNRTVSNGSIAPCIFSREYENVLEQTYFDSVNNYKNTALVAGAGEGSARKLTYIENSRGLDRYELYVDARDIQDKEQQEVSKTDSEGNKTTETIDVEIPWHRYREQLIQRGREKLSECKEIQTFESKINTQGNNVYKIDYDIGDIVTVLDKKWGLRVDTRITEIEEIHEGGRVEINPVFGNNIPTIIDKIKRMVR